MGIRKALIPFHFGNKLNIIPNRERPTDWTVIDEPKTIVGRLQRLSNIANDAKKADERLLVVSGDCMAAIPSHPASGQSDLFWFDAHGDFHTLETTETGSIGGMPLAMMMGLGDQSLMHCCFRWPIQSRRKHPNGVFVAHVGGSEFDDGEYNRMVQHINVFDALLDGYLYNKQHQLHLHVDTDVIREDEFRSAFHPAPDGMPLDTFYNQMRLLLPFADVLSIKSYDPRRDLDGSGEKVVLTLIRMFEDAVDAQ